MLKTHLPQQRHEHVCWESIVQIEWSACRQLLSLPNLYLWAHTVFRFIFRAPYCAFGRARVLNRSWRYHTLPVKATDHTHTHTLRLTEVLEKGKLRLFPHQLARYENLVRLVSLGSGGWNNLAMLSHLDMNPESPSPFIQNFILPTTGICTTSLWAIYIWPDFLLLIYLF